MKRLGRLLPPLLAAALLLTGSTCLVYDYYHRDEGFCPRRLKPLTREECILEAPALSELSQKELSFILSQPFDYLNKGAQCYTFASEDGRYVLKILKTYHLRLFRFLDKIPIPESFQTWRDARALKKAKKRHATLASYQLALSRLRDQTGLIAGQWAGSLELDQTLSLRFPSGKQLLLPAQSIDFLLQRRAVMAEDAIELALREGKPHKIRSILDAYSGIVHELCERGVYDCDASFDGCYGFVDGKALWTDVGELVPFEQSQHPKALAEMEGRLEQWLERRFPQLKEALTSEEVLHNAFDDEVAGI